MAEQSGERRVPAEVGEELVSLMVPDVDPELVQLVLSRAARGAAGGPGHQGQRGGGGESRAGLLREQVELLVLIRDAGIGRARLRAILGLDPEALPDGDGDPHPPVQ